MTTDAQVTKPAPPVTADVFLSAWLTPPEVRQLTGLVQRAAQCRKLAEMGVPFKLNGVGRPLVERVAVLSRKAIQNGQAA